MAVVIAIMVHRLVARAERIMMRNSVIFSNIENLAFLNKLGKFYDCLG